MAEAVSSESPLFMRLAGGINYKTHHAAHQFELGMTATDICPASAERFLYL